MDQKLTPQQSNIEFPRLKNFQKALTNNMKNTPKNLDLNQAIQKYTCQIFLPKRKNLESKILKPPKSLIILITKNPEDPPATKINGEINTKRFRYLKFHGEKLRTNNL